MVLGGSALAKLSTEAVAAAAEPECYAHSLAGKPREQWQTLEAHSRQVAALAGQFAETFGSSAWAALLGQLHDAGKSRRAFQAYLARANGLTDEAYDAAGHGHSGVGACWAKAQWGPVGQLLAYCLAGHHAGLPD
ncbi:MAG: CRISPR-associated endonuclease Cas3'' [Candidatus Spyradenecus sp.]